MDSTALSAKGVVAYAHTACPAAARHTTNTRFHVTPSESEGSAPDRSLPILVADTATLKVITRVGREGAQVICGTVAREAASLFQERTGGGYYTLCIHACIHSEPDSTYQYMYSEVLRPYSPCRMSTTTY